MEKQHVARILAIPGGLRESLIVKGNPGEGEKRRPMSRQWVTRRGEKHPDPQIRRLATALSDQRECE